MAWWDPGVSVEESLTVRVGGAELGLLDLEPVPHGIPLSDQLRSSPEFTTGPSAIEVPWDPTRSASARLGELAGCPSGYGVIYATPEYGDQLYTRKCRAVDATSAADIIRETQGGLGDRILGELFPTTPPGAECATLDLACHLRRARPYLVGGALLLGLLAVAYVVRAFR